MSGQSSDPGVLVTPGSVGKHLAQWATEGGEHERIYTCRTDHHQGVRWNPNAVQCWKAIAGDDFQRKSEHSLPEYVPRAGNSALTRISRRPWRQLCCYPVGRWL